MNSPKTRRFLLGASALLTALFVGPSTQANVITEWNTMFTDSLTVPAERGPRVPSRALTIMHLSMFEAINGIERKYEPYVVKQPAPPGARVEAAAIQAAYTVLSTLLPGHKAVYDAQLQSSLAAIPGAEGNSQSIQRGREWGETVAKAVIAARATDGATTVLPPFVGATTAGYWRHLPLTGSPTAGYANLVTMPFVVTNPMSFDPGPPYGSADRMVAMASAAYAADVNEVKDRGGLTSSVRTDAELEEALFLDACDIAGLNGVLRAKMNPNAHLVDSARTFALVNMAAFDATVVFFRLKYHHALWRPFQAIHYANEDGNPATVADTTWQSRLPTPPHPEFVSAHVTLFTAIVQSIARLEGDSGEVQITATASAAPYPGGTKSFASLAAISDQCVKARINVGFHFRETGETSQVVGRAIGDFVIDHGLPARVRP